MIKERIANLQNSIRSNAEYLYSLYLRLHAYKERLYGLYFNKMCCENFEDERHYEVEICEFRREYNDFKEYVKRCEKEQKECKSTLKRLLTEKED